MTLKELNALEARFDGPIPEHLLQSRTIKQDILLLESILKNHGSYIEESVRVKLEEELTDLRHQRAHNAIVESIT